MKKKIKSLLKIGGAVMFVYAMAFGVSTSIGHSRNTSDVSLIVFLGIEEALAQDEVIGGQYKKGCLLKPGCKWHETNNNCTDTFINC